MQNDLTIAVVDRAQEARALGQWQQAYELLTEGDSIAPLDGADLAFLADMAYAAGHLDVTINTWERLYEQCLNEGARLEAAGAAIRIAMHMLFDTALLAPVRGWLRRSEQLLEGFSGTPVHAWVAVIRNYERLLSGDFPEARLWARRAIEIGTDAAPAAAAIGRIAEARSLILEGHVSPGLELLNEAGVAAVSGGLDPLSTGIVYCELVCALQALAQYDLAEEWTEAMERWRQGQPVGSVHGRCRVHRAEILRLRGHNNEAEREALLACEELRPYLRRELGWPLTELGRIRLHIGDTSGAEEAFLAAHAAAWDPQPGLARVHMAHGNTALAAASIREALDNPPNVPSKEMPPNSDLRRAPLLEAQVEIELAVGDQQRALTAAQELAQIADSFESKALRASAALAFGRVSRAQGDLEAARRHLEDAVRGWNEVGAPYEVAVARMELAKVYRAEGSEERSMLEFRAAESLFKQIGSLSQAALAAQAGCEPEPASAAEPAAQASAIEPGLHHDDCGFRREGDYWALTFEGSTTRLRDLKGMRYLTRLLTSPGVEIHVLDLVATEQGQKGARRIAPSSPLQLDAGALLDPQAKESYRRRLAEIEEDIEEAREMGNDERAYQAETERDFLVRELARAVGLGGRDRHPASPSERARAGVTRAIRQAMARIQQAHPSLGQHLERTIHTGTYCAYLPDPRFLTAWSIAS